MKKTGALVSSLVMSSTLLGGAAIAQELGAEELLRVPVEGAAYCHMKYPAMLEDTLSWTHPVFDDGTVSTVDFYGSCDHDPFGIDEIKTERRVRLRGIYGDGE